VFVGKWSRRFFPGPLLNTLGLNPILILRGASCKGWGWGSSPRRKVKVSKKSEGFKFLTDELKPGSLDLLCHILCYI
jgi:hypothetical protein